MNNDGQRKRRRTAEQPKLPAFCDASATVAASTFGARRLPEIKTLYARRSVKDSKLEDSLASGGGKTSSRHLRRRATSHASRKRHRYPNGGQTGNTITSEPSRRKRRRPSALVTAHELWRQQQTISESSNAPESNDVVHWLPTHIWHAKRFRMESLWGWKVPMVHSNRGARAALRLVREGKTLLQDATWCQQPICMQFPRPSAPDMVSALQRAIPGFAMDSRMREGLVYEIDGFPLRAIGPIQWLLLSQEILGSVKDASPGSFFLYFFLHPSLQDDVLRCLYPLCQTIADCVLSNGLESGLACIRLRGENAVTCIRQALTTMDDIALESHGDSSAVILGDPESAASRLSVLLIAKQPRDKTVACNFGVSGLDVFCSVSLVNDLFLALILRGGACPIGEVERNHLLLEASPPMLDFPRDFVDTEQGLCYWGTKVSDWKTVRFYWEAGLGRTRLREAGAVVWSDLLDDRHGTTCVTVRGSFGAPFQQALISAAPSIVKRDQERPSRRNRRPSRSSKVCVQAPPLSRDDRGKHESVCTTLQQSLSLPALLVCDVLLFKGVAESGSPVYATEAGSESLGYLTTCVFSHSRGSCHGIAICSAARLLQAMALAPEHRAVLVTRASPHAVRLRGFVGTARHEGALSLLL